MVGMTVTVTGLDEFVATTHDESVFMEPAVELVTGLGLIAERASREGMPKDTAEGARSIVSQVDGLTARVTSPLVHVAVMDQGRRAGAPMPPPEALLGWMGRHGIPAEMAFVVARAIGRRGIAGRFFYHKAVEVVHRAIPDAKRKYVEAVRARFGGRH